MFEHVFNVFQSKSISCISLPISLKHKKRKSLKINYF